MEIKSTNEEILDKIHAESERLLEKRKRDDAATQLRLMERSSAVSSADIDTTLIDLALKVSEIISSDSPERDRLVSALRKSAYPEEKEIVTQPQPTPSTSLATPTAVASKVTKSPNPAAKKRTRVEEESDDSDIEVDMDDDNQVINKDDSMLSDIFNDLTIISSVVKEGKGN